MLGEDRAKGVDVDKAMRTVLDARVRAIRCWRPWLMIVILAGVGSLVGAFILSVVDGAATDSWNAFFWAGVVLVSVGTIAAILVRQLEIRSLHGLWCDVSRLSVQSRPGQTESRS